MATTPPGRDDRPDPPGRLEQVVLAGLVRDGGAGPVHEPVAAADPHVLLLRPEEPQARPERQDGHQHERVRPAHVAEAVDGGAGRQALATVEPDAEVAAGQARHGDPRHPVADRPADRADGRTRAGRCDPRTRVGGVIGRPSAGSRSASRSRTQVGQVLRSRAPAGRCGSGRARPSSRPPCRPGPR